MNKKRPMNCSTIMITGANRGIGLEFVKQYAAEDNQIIALVRDPENCEELKVLASNADIQIEKSDISQPDEIQAVAEKLSGRPIDILINNAGVIGPLNFGSPDFQTFLAPQTFGTLEYDSWMRTITVNAFGPIRVAEAFFENVARSTVKKIAFISTTVASIGESEDPLLIYGTSKIILNKAVSLSSKSWAQRGVTSLLLCPGKVKTSMGPPEAELEPSESVQGLRHLISTTTLEQTGRFTRYNGEPIVW